MRDARQSRAAQQKKRGPALLPDERGQDRPTDPVPCHARGPVGRPFIRKPLTIRDNYSSENSKSLQPFLSSPPPSLPSFRRTEKIEELRPGAKRSRPSLIADSLSFKLPHKNYGFIATRERGGRGLGRWGKVLCACLPSTVRLNQHILCES